MNILIIEDEGHAAKRLIQLAKAHFPEATFHGHLDSIRSSVKWLESNAIPDLIFCDIQLADGISFKIFEEISVLSPVIFTTAFDHFAIQAFKVNAIDYLLKPLDPEALDKAVDKFKRQQIKTSLDLNMLKDLITGKEKNFKSRFLVRFGEKIQSIPTEEVAFFFSEERVTFLQTHSGKKYVIDYTLEQTESMVDPKKFFRLNRKFLVTLSSISDIITYSNSRLKVILTKCENQDILISREKVSDFKHWLDQ